MSIGSSGRVVIEIEPQLKKELHDLLRNEGTNLKSWFLDQVNEFLAEKSQKPLPFDKSNQNDTKEILR